MQVKVAIFMNVGGFIMAAIEKRGTNSYRLTVSCGYNHLGKKLLKRKTITLPIDLTEKQKEKELNIQLVLFQKEVENGTYLDGGKITFEEFSIKWIEDYAKVELRPKTIARYIDLLEKRIFPAIGHIKLEKLQPTHLMQFYKNLAEDGIRLDYRYTIKAECIPLITSTKPIAAATNLNERTIKQIINGNVTTKESAEKICLALKKPLLSMFDIVNKSKGLSSKTINHHHRLISAILSTAVHWQVLLNNPALRVKSPKVEKKEAKFYNFEELKMMLDLLEKEHIKYQAMINIVLYCGLRLGELSVLEWSDFNFNKKLLKINKQLQYLPTHGIYELDQAKTPSSNREISIPDTLIEVLEKFKNWQSEERLRLGDKLTVVNDKLFTKENGSPIFPDTPSRWFSKFVKKNNLPKLTFHQIRHTNASILISEGVDIPTVSARLGHSDKNVTLNTYAHAIKERDVEASNKLNNLAKSLKLKEPVK